METNRIEHRRIKLLYVEDEKESVEGARLFFQVSLERLGASLEFHWVKELPARIQGFDIVSLDERVDNGRVTELLAENPGLRADLTGVPVINIHSFSGPFLATTYKKLLPGKTLNYTEKGDLNPTMAMDRWWEFPELGLFLPAEDAG